MMPDCSSVCSSYRCQGCVLRLYSACEVNVSGLGLMPRLRMANTGVKTATDELRESLPPSQRLRTDRRYDGYVKSCHDTHSHLLWIASASVLCIYTVPVSLMQYPKDYHLHTERRARRSVCWCYDLVASRFGFTPLRFTCYWLLALFVLATTLVVRNLSSRDPGSWFFDPEVAYSRKYSDVREGQAEQFVAAATNQRPYDKSDETGAGLCVGIPSIARDGARYLSLAVGSLLSGLSHEERGAIYLIVFIPHTDPSIHPAYHKTWLWKLADEVLQYNLSTQQLEYVKSLEREDVQHRTKGLYDYTYLLKACYEKGMAYIAMIEDDIIALDGWYHRTVKGISELEARASRARTGRSFLYLRLFYTEEFLGWNNESWPSYAFWSLCVIAGSSLLLHLAGSTSPTVKRIFTPWLTLFVSLMVVPWAVVLVFAAGKVTVAPLPAGINEMNNFGCCAQGLVFPRQKAYDLIGWYEKSRMGFADMLTEQYANEHGEQRWALTPSVLQHIGAKSSKPDDFGHGAKYSKSVAGTIWNFAFELNRPETLRKEHELAAIDPTPLRA